MNALWIFAMYRRSTNKQGPGFAGSFFLMEDLMSLDKSIKYGKEKRVPYRKAKAVDKTCHNHGSCPYCKSNRLHKYQKRLLSAKDKVTLFYIDNTDKI